MSSYNYASHTTEMVLFSAVSLRTDLSCIVISKSSVPYLSEDVSLYFRIMFLYQLTKYCSIKTEISAGVLHSHTLHPCCLTNSISVWLNFYYCRGWSCGPLGRTQWAKCGPCVQVTSTKPIVRVLPTWNGD